MFCKLFVRITSFVIINSFAISAIYSQTIVSKDLVFVGGNDWRFHNPNDDRKVLFLAPFKEDGSGTNWASQTIFKNDGNVIFSGKIGIGNLSPTYKLDVKNSGVEDREYLLAGFRHKDGQGVYMGYVSNGTITTEARIRSGAGVNLSLGTTSFRQAIVIDNKNKRVGIGTSTPKSELSVEGTIWAREVKVSLKDGADWVFEKDYQLKTLAEVEVFIKRNKHLPEIPSADEFRANDMNVSEMSNKLLQKIEELTLYAIEQEKKLKKQEEANIDMKAVNQELNNRLTRLEKLVRE